jgi:integrase
VPKSIHLFEIDQVLKLLGAARSVSEIDWLMIAMAFIHGLRASEVVGGWSVHTDKKTKKVTRSKHPGITPAAIIGERFVLKRLKNSNPVEDEIAEHVVALLNVRKPLFDLVAAKGPNQRLFPISARTFQRKMHLYGEMAGLPKLYCHPHTLKHSVLDYLRTRLPLEELQDRSGHKSLDSLRIYLHPKKAVVDQRVRTALGSIAV